MRIILGWSGRTLSHQFSCVLLPLFPVPGYKSNGNTHKIVATAFSRTTLTKFTLPRPPQTLLAAMPPKEDTEFLLFLQQDPFGKSCLESDTEHSGNEDEVDDSVPPVGVEINERTLDPFRSLHSAGEANRAEGNKLRGYGPDAEHSHHNPPHGEAKREDGVCASKADVCEVEEAVVVSTSCKSACKRVSCLCLDAEWRS
jgi:hypothetical protein